MNRWDDLEILRLMDELEGSQSGFLMNGWQLMERARPHDELDYQNDPHAFAHELVIAREAGLLTFDDRWVQPPGDPQRDANLWLQQIRNLALTVTGRDRARGRVIVTPLPDPDEDDGRMIGGLILEEIARAIADAFTPSQMPRFFIESGVPEEFVPAAVADGQAKWEYALSLLDALHEGGSAGRRALRTFIGAYLDDRLHESPTGREQRRIVDRLARQGWQVKDGVLVIGERTAADAGALAPLEKDARIAALHPEVRQVAEGYLDSAHPEAAIFAAFKAINLRIKNMTGIDDDGLSLINKAMAGNNPPIAFADLTTETGRNIQFGVRFMFMGAVSGIRNPDAHEQFRVRTDEEAFEELSFASMLMRRLDGATVTTSP